MIKKMSVALIAVGALSFVASAQADEFAAAPMNPGPPRVTGMGPVGELANVALMPGNVVTQPVIGPILVPAAATPAPAPMVRHHRRHRHHM